MKTLILVIAFALLAGAGASMLDLPIDPITSALVASIIVLLFRFKRAYGISLHVDELFNEQSDRYDDVYLRRNELSNKEHNELVREIDATNEDIDNIRGIKW